MYTVGDLLTRAASIHGDKTAIKHRDTGISYRDLYDDALKLKGLIRNLGISRGDRVGVYLDQSIEQVLAMFAVSMAGGVFVFINPVLKANQIEHIMRDCQIDALITDLELMSKQQFTTPRLVIHMGDADAGPKVHSWLATKPKLQADCFPVPICSEDIACLIYTSGSTGMSKGVVVPHRTVVDGARIVSSYLNISHQDRILSVLPINFDYGLNQVTSAILHGALLVLHKFVMLKDLFDVLEREEITGFPGMPPIWAKIFNEKIDLSKARRLPHLRYLTNTGGKVPRATVERIRSFFPESQLFLMYGLTEAFRSSYLPPEELDRRPDSMGKAIPGVEILVVDSEGEECNSGEVGELVHRGALVTLGYWNDAEKTGKIFRKNARLSGQPHLHELVVYSGDLVKKDDEGFLYFVSRRDNLIKSSGYRVSPDEVEEGIIGIPGIENAIVFGRDVESGEQIIVAVLESMYTIEDTQTILRECRLRLPNYMVPRELYFERELARTANGKLDRANAKKKVLTAGKFGEVN